jgi:hypothetical protein
MPCSIAGSLQLPSLLNYLRTLDMLLTCFPSSTYCRTCLHLVHFKTGNHLDTNTIWSYPNVLDGIVARPVQVKSSIRSVQELGFNNQFIPIPDHSLLCISVIPNVLVFPGEIDITRFETAVSLLGSLWPSLNARFVSRITLEDNRQDDFAVSCPQFIWQLA